jgi:hypothetical protein
MPQLKDDWMAGLRQLQPNWNSYRGRPITEEAITALANFYVIPTSYGGVQLEVHQDGFDVEIVIDPSGRIESGMICRCPWAATEA